MVHLATPYEIACAAGNDAAEMQCRAAGRKRWVEEDYQLASKTACELLEAGIGAYGCSIWVGEASRSN